MQEMQGTRAWSLGREDPLVEGMATHSSILAWRIPRTEEPGGLQSMGSQKSWTWLKIPWCWEKLKAGEGDDRGWDGWMASPTQWTWGWTNSGRWRTGKPGMLQSMGSQRVRHDLATEQQPPPLAKNYFSNLLQGFTPSILFFLYFRSLSWIIIIIIIIS